MKIGVRLPSRFTDAGDYLADVRALDAIGVNSLWLPDDGFDPWLMLGLIRQESAYDPRARSGSNARGLTQVIPSTAHDLATGIDRRTAGDE